MGRDFDTSHRRVGDGNRRDVLFAVLLHAVAFALMFAGLLFKRDSEQVSVAGPVIEATLISAEDASLPPSPPVKNPTPPKPTPTPPKPVELPKPEPEEAAPPPQPEPEPRPEDSPAPPQVKPQTIAKDDTVDQERASRLAMAQEQREKQEQEAKARQAQIDLTEQKEQEEAERKRRRTQMQLEREKQLADIRKARAAAQKQTELAEKKLRDLQNRPAPAPEAPPAPNLGAPTPGNAGTDTGLQAKYVLAMQQLAQQAWRRPDNLPPRTNCKVTVTQIPGGEVIDFKFLSCGYDEQGRQSVERALSQLVLPYAGFEPVFERQVNIQFCYPKEECPP